MVNKDYHKLVKLFNRHFTVSHELSSPFTLESNADAIFISVNKMLYSSADSVPSVIFYCRVSVSVDAETCSS